jgi:uncharacterized protein (TIGR03086 family)
MDASMYERALERTRTVVANTRRDQLGDPTPCGDWDVRALLNHIIGGCVTFAAGAEGRQADFANPEDHASRDYVAEYDNASRAALDAFAAPGAMEREFALPWGKTPGAAALGLALADAVVHGWDLATATKQEIMIDDDIAEALYGMTSSMMQPEGSYPRGDSFAEPIEVAHDAPPRDRLLAYLGRDPAS